MKAEVNVGVVVGDIGASVPADGVLAAAAAASLTWGGLLLSVGLPLLLSSSQ